MSDHDKKPTLSDMPNEIRAMIFSRLGDADEETLLNCRAVSRDFKVWTDRTTPIRRRIVWAKVLSYLDPYADRDAYLACRAVSAEFKDLVDLKTAFWRDNQQLLWEAMEDGRKDIFGLIYNRINPFRPSGQCRQS